MADIRDFVPTHECNAFCRDSGHALMSWTGCTDLEREREILPVQIAMLTGGTFRVVHIERAHESPRPTGMTTLVQFGQVVGLGHIEPDAVGYLCIVEPVCSQAVR